MEYSKQIIKRVKIIDGQMRGIIMMMDEGRECDFVINQLSAVRSAIASGIGAIVASNLTNELCKQVQSETNLKESVNSSIKLIVKSK